MMNKIYIGKTQQNFKKRMVGHSQDVKKLMEKGVHSDSYARHFSHRHLTKRSCRHGPTISVPKYVLFLSVTRHFEKTRLDFGSKS
jgi:hypothetical protein